MFFIVIQMFIENYFKNVLYHYCSSRWVRLCWWLWSIWQWPKWGLPSRFRGDQANDEAATAGQQRMANENDDGDASNFMVTVDRRMRLGSSTSKTLDRTIPQPILPPLFAFYGPLPFTCRWLRCPFFFQWCKSLATLAHQLHLADRWTDCHRSN